VHVLEGGRFWLAGRGRGNVFGVRDYVAGGQMQQLHPFFFLFFFFFFFFSLVNAAYLQPFPSAPYLSIPTTYIIRGLTGGVMYSPEFLHT
jgi:hypothetical protein